MTSYPTHDVLAAKLCVPEHVVYRSFVAETVVLNLRTGQYHGLNPTAARMLEALAEAQTAGAAIPVLAEEYGVDPDRIEEDLRTLCQALLDRGLLEIVDDDDAR
jgi:PqqD family protein of HPr-rel-A system